MTELKASPVYRSSSKSARATSQDSVKQQASKQAGVHVRGRESSACKAFYGKPDDLDEKNQLPHDTF